METAGIVDVSLNRLKIVEPDHVPMPEGGLNLRWPEEPFAKLEERLARFKVPAALAWARANRLDRNVYGVPDGEPALLGIVSCGKAWLDVMQALSDLGIDDRVARSIGLRVYKVAMPWPLEPIGIRAFSSACQEVLVIEEKRSLIEAQIRDILYAASVRPVITGKRDAAGAPLLPEWGELSPSACAKAIVLRLTAWSASGSPADSLLGATLQRCHERLALIAEKERTEVARSAPVERIPYFCSGCPHNSSTRVPEGSRAIAGIGCSYMAMWMDRGTATFTHMGGEGATWVGQAPFTATNHVFQNIGDGTYFHSGSLAIRFAIATKTRITYKILFNDAVAMTGGQEHDGQLTPAAIVNQMRAEGVQKIVVATDEPEKYPAGYFAPDVAVHHRSMLDEVQRELRDFPGVSVLVYDQTCAAEKRRRRKRDAAAPMLRKVFINEHVCENCGDCTVASNCVSVQPIESAFGRKRTINQSSCNGDQSCVEGFCPSFVTVKGGRLRLAKAVAVGSTTAEGSSKALTPGAASSTLPEPLLPTIEEAYSLLVTGIGGTGVITIGHLLGMAAHLEGKEVTVLDMTGLAQKNGAVMSFIRLGKSGQALYSPRIGIASADAVIGCDLVVSAGREALARMSKGKTRVVVNANLTPTSDFARDADWTVSTDSMEAEIRASLSDEACSVVDATRLATALLGDAIATNMFMLGFAWQKGLVPLSAGAIDRAIELNGVAVAENRAAFAWGRVAAVDPSHVEKMAVPTSPVKIVRRSKAPLGELVRHRREFLTSYQNSAYAERYATLVSQAIEKESLVTSGASTKLAEAVARNFAKLMAYKDEYEVARLYSETGFLDRLKEQVEGDFTISFHLAPPLWARRDSHGNPRKSEYGRWMVGALRVLSKLRRLRGTPFDVFGYTAERRQDRELVNLYEATMKDVLGRLHSGNLRVAVEIAALPDKIRGFGHVRAESIAAAADLRDKLLQELDAAPLLRAAA